MPRIYLCFLWHMHQPYYKDLATGEYKLPWTRMHGLKDYYGMARILEEFPRVRQTFNLVPSMVAQLKEYAAGEAADPFLELALKPAESLTDSEQEFLVRHSFHADADRMIRRYPRYAELYGALQAQRGANRLHRLFTAQEFRDLQVLSQVAWFDEEFQANDREVGYLVEKGRQFTLADQELVSRKQREILGVVLPAYRRLASAGQIEISTTPYYHPILPLLCDSNIAGVSHPNVPLPPRFRYPLDARAQLEMARAYTAAEFGAPPVGLWPSEGSVSDEALTLASQTGFRWAATDSGVLSRTLGRAIGVDEIYRPYLWEQQGKQVRVLFRDHFLSDLIGFVYSRMEAREAALDFLHRIRENCRGILSARRDALVPIILDGENAWEYYDRNGRPFLRELYSLISSDEGLVATTVADAIEHVSADRLGHIFPGSWINANFDVWIGAEEDNQAWVQLLRARETYDAAANVPEARRRLAYEELLIAEGSDWCWWYGPEHDSANRIEFDQLYRSHLANVYRFLGLAPPEELSRPILRLAVREIRQPPAGQIHPRVDGEVTSYFEWLGAGLYRVDDRSGSMHGKKFLVREVQYGADNTNVYLRVDFHSGSEPAVKEMEARLTFQADGAGRASYLILNLDHGKAHVERAELARTPAPGSSQVECAFRHILEVRVALAALGIEAGASLHMQFSLWRGGLPMDAIPGQGWITIPTGNPADWEA
jgi:alpha-amylase/alpha-mannosidase (GH57 family)